MPRRPVGKTKIGGKEREKRDKAAYLARTSHGKTGQQTQPQQQGGGRKQRRSQGAGSGQVAANEPRIESWLQAHPGTSRSDAKRALGLKHGGGKGIKIEEIPRALEQFAPEIREYQALRGCTLQAAIKAVRNKYGLGKFYQ